MLEGFKFIGTEMDLSHAQVARARCAHAQAKAAEPVPHAKAEPAINPETLPLFGDQQAA